MLGYDGCYGEGCTSSGMVFVTLFHVCFDLCIVYGVGVCGVVCVVI